MNKRVAGWSTVFSGTLLFVFFASFPVFAGEGTKTAARGTATAKANWQQDWETTLQKAKKEGSVSIYTTWSPEMRTALTRGFKAKYGINVEFTPFSRGGEIAAKAQTEKTAGMYNVDVFGAGGPTVITALKPAGLVGNIEQLLILPEVADPKSWRGGKFPFVDKARQCVNLMAYVDHDLLFNTELVKKGEITKYKDLLKPEYKGKITVNDPTVTGAGLAMMTHLAYNIWNIEEAKNFLTQLLKVQGAVIQRDNRLHIESVARGKFTIGLAPLMDGVKEFINANAPLDVAISSEGTYVTTGPGAMAVPVQAAHPNAARVFVNWLLTKEGQTIFNQSSGIPSMRSDVPIKGMNPIFLPHPNEKLFFQTEEDILFQAKMIGVSKEIIEGLRK